MICIPIRVDQPFTVYAVILLACALCLYSVYLGSQFYVQCKQDLDFILLLCLCVILTVQVQQNSSRQQGCSNCSGLVSGFSINIV